MPTTHLPPQPTPFVGRETELNEITAQLAEPNCRLLTLLGPGGIGKTRLALQAAANQLPHFEDGVYFVALAPISSPDLLSAAIASAMEISFYGAEDRTIQLARYLREKKILLVMDNFEHLLEGINLLTDILQAARDMKILATSRERLNLQEEWVFPLDGLSYPTEATHDALENYSALQLFMQRARQMQAHFAFEQNEQAVLAICRQVEGMPLALELAASWLRVMPCQQIVTRMERNLDFLTTPLRNIPERHRSLRMVFEQSWSLLSTSERDVLMKLAVFRGGFDLEAAEEVAGATLTVLAGLADKSLIRLNANGRYDLHEMLRQYAAGKLSDADETIHTAEQHLRYFVKLAEQGEAHAYGREQVTWYDRLEDEMDNLRAALAWSLTSEEIERGLRITAALRWMWEMRGHLSEGVVWCEKLLSGSEDVSPAIRAKALQRASETAWLANAQRQANLWSREALRLSRALNDKWNLAWSLTYMGGFFNLSQNLGQAAAMLEESIALFRELEDPFGLSHVLRRRAILAINLKDYPYAQRLLEEALTRDREAGDKNAIAWENFLIGVVLWNRYRNPGQVAGLYEESLALFRAIRDIQGEANPLVMLAEMERYQGNYERSRALNKEVILLLRSIGMQMSYGVTMALAGMTGLAVVESQFERAAILLGTVNDRLNDLTYIYISQQENFEDHVTTVRTHLGEAAFEKARAEGQAMTLEQAIVYALQDEPSLMEAAAARAQQDSTQSLVETLSTRELEVLRLIAEGLSNSEIAQRLFLTVGTVKVHSRNIYGKLGANNRTQAVTQAQKLNLL